MIEEFFVKSDSFPLLRAFKEECEKMGWEYDERFCHFSDRKVGPEGSGKVATGLYFEIRNGKKPWFSLSNSNDHVYTLPQQWNKALQNAQKLADACKVIEITENDIRTKFNIASEVQIKIIK